MMKANSSFSRRLSVGFVIVACANLGQAGAGQQQRKSNKVHSASLQDSLLDGAEGLAGKVLTFCKLSNNLIGDLHLPEDSDLGGQQLAISSAELFVSNDVPEYVLRGGSGHDVATGCHKGGVCYEIDLHGELTLLPGQPVTVPVYYQPRTASETTARALLSRFAFFYYARVGKLTLGHGITEDDVECLKGTPLAVNDYGSAGIQWVYPPRPYGGQLMVYFNSRTRTVTDVQVMGMRR